MRLFKVTTESIELIEEIAHLGKSLSELKYNAGTDWSDSDGRDRKRMKAEISYVFYMYSRFSPYKGYNKAERQISAKKRSNLPDAWQESTVLKNFINEIIELEDNTDAKRTLRTVRNMLQKMRSEIDNIDFGEEVQGKPKYDMAKYIKIGKELNGLLEELKILETLVDSEDDVSQDRMRGNATKGSREDPREEKREILL